MAVLIGGGVFGFGGMALGVPVFAVFYRYVNKITTRSLKKKNKEIHSVSYMSLEQFGINDDEIELEPEKKKQESIFVKIKRKLEQEQDKKTSSVKPDEESEDMDELWSVEHPVGEPRHKSPKVYSHIDGDKE